MLLLGGGVLCGELRINSADELVEFSNNVNSGTNYSGTTVFLDSDIDLNGKAFEPIGNETYYFLGTFDGQGHIISNLVMNSNSQCAGLFGYSEGTTIRNVVMDSSCSVASFYNSFSYVGGIIGKCDSKGGSCIIENTVNMESVSFDGNSSSGYLYLGGIAGRLYSSSGYDVTAKNCANYGSVSHTGTSGNSYIGGISGYSSGSSSLTFIQGCLNYGTITNNNTKSSYQNNGGVVGYTYRMTLDSCVSAGKIISNYSTGYIGGIVGYLSYSQISHCYWSKDISQSAFGYVFSSSISDTPSFDSAAFELSESVSVWNYTGTSLLEALNAFSSHYYLRDYSHWALNRNSNTVTFTINGRTNPITLDSPIILLPSLASEGLLWFDGWYTDASCASPLASFEITSDKEVYGKWGENTNSYTITFDTRGGTAIESITAQFGGVISLPRDTKRDSCTVAWWVNDYGDIVPWDFTVPAHNLTLHAVWSCTFIRTAADLVDFSRVVNSGASDFYGMTVFLDSDIDFTDEFSQRFEPIDGFQGTFDGQGHTISNLVINSPLENVGLFGYSGGTTIRNVVMDSSCSVTSTYYPVEWLGYTYVGGIIGKCDSYDSPCIIEDAVNMGYIALNEDIGMADIHLGGIVGCLSLRTYEISVKNCVSYGFISHKGASGYVYIGGIVGISQSYSSSFISIQNSLNCGSIIFSGVSNYELSIGGIAGYTKYTSLENCVSAGRITSNTVANYTGSVVGKVDYSNAIIIHCLWTSDVGYVEACGTGTPVVTESSLIPTLDNATVIGELNEYAEKNSTWSRWVMLHLNGGNINSLGQEAPIGGLLKSLPLPVKKGHKLLFWCTDEGFSEQYDPQTSDASSVEDLYAIWTIGNYTVTFDGNGGTPSKESIVVTYNTPYGDLPTASRTGHTFLGWFTEEVDGEEVTSETAFTIAKDQTLYAHWAINNYIVTFIFNDGTEVYAEFPFNSTIAYPDGMSREGFVFAGWVPNPERMEAGNIIIRAQWNITKPSEYVEIVFSRKDLSDDEIKEIIGNYAPEGGEFTIVKIEPDELGELKVIIKFIDQEKASEFVRNVNEHKRSDDGIKLVRSATEYVSFTFSIHPALSFFLFFVV